MAPSVPPCGTSRPRASRKSPDRNPDHSYPTDIYPLAGHLHLASRTYFDGKGTLMNRDILKGKWTQLKGDVRNWWGKLTDDDVTQIQGDFEKMIGKLQERYGYTREQAERDLTDFVNAPEGRRRRTA